MNNLIKYFFSTMKEQTLNNKDNKDIKEKDLDYRKIKNYLRKHSSTIADDNQLRLKLHQLFYYDIDCIPIAILKPEDESYNNDNFPYYFQ